MIKNFSKKQGFVIPLIITIIAVLAIGGVVYLAPEKKVEAPVVSDTSDWKTYKNEKYGYEIKYPDGVKINKEQEEDTAKLSETDRLEIDSIKVIVWARLDSVQNIKEENLRDLSTESNFPDKQVSRIQEKDFAGTKAYFYVLTNYMDGYGHEDFTKLFVESGQYSFEIDYPHTDLLSNQILNTFKFIMPVKETPVACTMDAMMCPDGSYVGRSGPKCEFVCPK